MTKSEFYALLDDILEQPPGTVKGDEPLAALENWDSLAVVSFIATTNAFFEITLDPAKLKECRTVPELLAIVGSHVES